MSLFKDILFSAIQGVAKELAINPRDIRFLAVIDEEEHLLARIDAHTVRDLLNRAAQMRVLRVQVGKIAYNIDLGSRRVSRGTISAPKQRGYK